MALQFRKFIDGIRVVPKSTGTSDQTGDLEVIASTGKLSYYNASETTKNSPLVTEAHSATLTNKTIDGDDNTIENLTLATLKTELSDADKVLRRDAAGVVISGNPLPADTTSQIVTLDSTDTLTNKTIDADLNTISNINDSEIKVGANIARSKLAAGTVSSIVVNDASGVLSDLSLTSAQIILGNASNIPTATTVTGEVTIDDLGVTTVGTVANSVISGLLQTQMENLAAASTISPTKSFIRLTTGAATIDGIAAGVDGQHLVLTNLSSSLLTIKNQSGVASANDRIVTGSSADIALENTASLFLIYNVTDSRWYVVGGSGGGSSTVSLSSSNSAVSIGESVYVDASGVAQLVDAGNDNAIEFIGVSLDAGGGAIRVQVSGEVTIPGASFTVGKPVFIDPLTAGNYTQTAPSTAGFWVVPVGIATASNKMAINGAGSATAVKITSEVDQFIYAAVATAPGTSGAVTLTNGNNILLVDASGASRTVTLPSPTAGKIFNIKKIDSSANTVVISAPSGTIDGTATKSLASQYDSLTITSDGTNFFII